MKRSPASNTTTDIIFHFLMSHKVVRYDQITFNGRNCPFVAEKPSECYPSCVTFTLDVDSRCVETRVSGSYHASVFMNGRDGSADSRSVRASLQVSPPQTRYRTEPPTRYRSAGRPATATDPLQVRATDPLQDRATDPLQVRATDPLQLKSTVVQKILMINIKPNCKYRLGEEV
ncbi:hypothetical protein F2P81_003373 [Scophthalmus maximus]|uniref:Uncharacterized protein n=1 Tax=Scophthalmus maximus TaxID=52904 RepID=A0A6A4TG94_SCOMX|nr:hypothetical protein F2P81_003373 [Scophthalmus maximus]